MTPSDLRRQNKPTALVVVHPEDYLPGRRIPDGVAAVRFTFCGPESLVEEVDGRGVVTKREIVSRERAERFLRAHTRKGPNPPARTPHPAHPMHPYFLGVPAAWRGRQIRY